MLILTFIVSFCFSVSFITPFQKEMKTPDFYQFSTNLIQNKELAENEINKLSKTENQTAFYLRILAKTIAEKFKETNMYPNITTDEFLTLLNHSFYIHMVLISLFFCCFWMFLYYILYILLIFIGPYFFDATEKSFWGRLLTIPWSVVLIIYPICFYFNFLIPISYTLTIALLCSLLLAVWVKKNFRYMA